MMRLYPLALALLVGSRSVAVGATDTGPAVIKVPITRIINETFYGMEFELGNPPQKSIIKVDTGSFSIGFNNPTSNLCQRSDKPCAALGSYDNLTSSTSVAAFPDDEYPDYFDELIDHGMGLFVNDTIRFAGTTVSNFTFGTLDIFAASFVIPSPAAGILGLGALCFNSAACTDFPTFLQQLVKKKFLQKRAFSVYLGPDEPDTVGTLLLGGVDRAKQDGPVITLPIVQPNSTTANFSPWVVNYTSFSLERSGLVKNSTTYPVTPGSASLWDTGNAFWNFPTALWQELSSIFGIPADADPSASPFAVDCKYRELVDDIIRVEFPGGGSIAIQLGRLVSHLSDGTCATFTGGYGGPAGGPPEPGNAFGAPYLRNVYVTFDLDSLTMSFSQVRYTRAEDICPI